MVYWTWSIGHGHTTSFLGLDPRDIVSSAGSMNGKWEIVYRAKYTGDALGLSDIVYGQGQVGYGQVKIGEVRIGLVGRSRMGHGQWNIVKKTWLLGLVWAMVSGLGSWKYRGMERTWFKG
ncbi:hypothetical protein DICA3_D25466 [Diutina catenulata]